MDLNRERQPDTSSSVVQLPGTSPKKERRKPVDFEALEIDYRAGRLTIKQLAALYGRSVGRICQYAEERGWERDLTHRARERAQRLVNRVAPGEPEAKHGLTLLDDVDQLAA